MLQENHHKDGSRPLVEVLLSVWRTRRNAQGHFLPPTITLNQVDRLRRILNEIVVVRDFLAIHRASSLRARDEMDDDTREAQAGIEQLLLGKLRTPAQDAAGASGAHTQASSPLATILRVTASVDQVQGRRTGKGGTRD